MSGLRARAGHRLARSLERGRMEDRVHDLLVPGTHAEVPLERLADLRLARRGGGGEERAGAHDHPRRAIPALHAEFLNERALHGMQATLARQALDGHDVQAVRLHRQHQAGLDSLALDEDGARPAVTGVAPDVGAGETRHLPDVVHQQEPRLDVVLEGLAVDPRSNAHWRYPVCRVRAPKEIPYRMNHAATMLSQAAWSTRRPTDWAGDMGQLSADGSGGPRRCQGSVVLDTERAGTRTRCLDRLGAPARRPPRPACGGGRYRRRDRPRWRR